MTTVVLIIGLLAIAACDALFFYMGFIVAAKKELRPYVLLAMVMGILGIVAMVCIKGYTEALGMTPIVAWMIGVGCGELRAWLKARRM